MLQVGQRGSSCCVQQTLRKKKKKKIKDRLMWCFRGNFQHTVSKGGTEKAIAEALILWIITITGSRNSGEVRANTSPAERRPEQLPPF